MPDLIAFYGKPEVKAEYLTRVRAHREADQIVKGQYWQDGKGCAVGCTIHSDDHNRYETELGIPEGLARLEDALFERMPSAEAMTWPERFLKVIPVGADLSMVGKRFVAWVARDLLDIPDLPADVVACVTLMADIMDRSIAGDEPSETQWSEAARAAWAAAAASAAGAACAARASVAEGAAGAAAAAAATRCAEKLLELLATAPVPEKATP